MCIAIVQTPGSKRIDADVLRTCYRNNPHGAGLAYIKDGKVVTAKGYFSADRFVEKYNAAYSRYGGSPMLIHCRIATSGATDQNNCHPFQVADGKLALIHNGILAPTVAKPTAKRSDTAVFAQFLRDAELRQIPDPAALQSIETIIGTSNKIAFLDSNGAYAIANEKQGHWINGVWYSNDTYRWDAYGTPWLDDDIDAPLWADRQDGCMECGQVLITKTEYRTDLCMECLLEAYEDARQEFAEHEIERIAK